MLLHVHIIFSLCRLQLYDGECFPEGCCSCLLLTCRLNLKASKQYCLVAHSVVSKGCLAEQLAAVKVINWVSIFWTMSHQAMSTRSSV